MSLKRKSSTEAWGSGWGQAGQGSSEDDELARAIAVSLGADVGPMPSSLPDQAYMSAMVWQVPLQHTQ